MYLGAVPLETTSHISDLDRGRSPYAADANSICVGSVAVFEMYHFENGSAENGNFFPTF